MKHIEAEFSDCAGNSLYYQCWLPDDRPKAVLLVVHGLAEHSGRYKNVVHYFVPVGYAVYAFDYTGHGQSAGKRGYIRRFACYLDDLAAFLGLVQSRHPGDIIFIIAHSVGATIAATYAIRQQNVLGGLLLSGTIIKPGASLSPVKIMLANLLASILPRMGLDRLDATAISRDRAVVDAYIRDPLVYCGRISARLGAELIRAMQNLRWQAPQLKLPVLIMHGTADRLCDVEGSKMLYQLVSSSDKTLKLYDGLYHEIFNEPQRGQVFKDMEDWLDDRIR